MFKKILLTAGMVLAVGVLWWTTIHTTQPKSQSGLRVTTSFYPLYELAKQVGGDKVQVTNITPAGSEPHDFEPSAKTIAEASRSNVFVYNGGMFEPWTEKFADRYSGVVVKGSEGMNLLQADDAGHDTDHQHEHAEVNDPHYWLDPVLAQQAITNIRDGLIKADGANAAYYTENARRYTEQLAQLHQDFTRGLAQCEQRTVIISHQSMSYLGKRYGLDVEAISGVSPQSDPPAARLAELTRIVREKGVRYIFFESLVSTRLADTIAKETGAQTLVLDPIEGLSDESQKAGKNYLSIQRENLGNLRRALACR